jgi:hypothetical protein
MIEHDSKRRERYWNARSYFSISNNTAGEMLAEIAMRHRNIVLGKTQQTVSQNLRELDAFMSEHRETLGWIPPRGGMTAFPWLVSGENSRAFCQACRTGHPARPRRLFRCALAFSPWLRGDDRQISPTPSTVWENSLIVGQPQT